MLPRKLQLLDQAVSQFIRKIAYHRQFCARLISSKPEENSISGYKFIFDWHASVSGSPTLTNCLYPAVKWPITVGCITGVYAYWWNARGNFVAVDFVHSFVTYWKFCKTGLYVLIKFDQIKCSKTWLSI